MYLNILELLKEHVFNDKEASRFREMIVDQVAEIQKQADLIECALVDYKREKSEESLKVFESKVCALHETGKELHYVCLAIQEHYIWPRRKREVVQEADYRKKFSEMESPL